MDFIPIPERFLPKSDEFLDKAENFLSPSLGRRDNNGKLGVVQIFKNITEIIHKKWNRIHQGLFKGEWYNNQTVCKLIERKIVEISELVDVNNNLEKDQNTVVSADMITQTEKIKKICGILETSGVNEKTFKKIKSNLVQIQERVELVQEKILRSKDPLKKDSATVAHPSVIEEVNVEAVQNQEQIDLDHIQKIALQGDLAKASMLLEEYSKHVKNAKLTEADICQGFEITDDSIGRDWKGIITVENYNKDFILEDEGERVTEDIEQVKSALTTYPRGFIFFRQGDQTFHPIRNNENGEPEIFDRTSKQWVPYTPEKLAGLKLGSEDWCISLGKPVLPQGAAIYKGIETLEANRSKAGYFYHEAQGPNSGSFCAVHAANQFLGKHAVDIADLYTFVRQKMIKSLGLEPEAIYGKDADVADARKGSDPGTLISFLKDRATLGLIDKRYAKLQSISAKVKDQWDDESFKAIPSECDRVIIGYGGSHFAAIRKDATNNKWYLVDSMLKDSQETAYDSLQDAIKNPDRASASTITLICEAAE